MTPLDIINKYYSKNSQLYTLLVNHSKSVAQKAIEIAKNHPEMELDLKFIEEAAMLHDIGIFMCNAPDIFCTGNEPYIKHGVIGAEILRNEGLPKHALVAERHTGSGITKEQIISGNLPIPVRDMLPITLEEKIICLADKFYSKSNPDKEKKIEKIRKSMSKHGEESLKRFDDLCSLLL
ncbi:MAG: HD domain-containing protein [Bacteroidales bacterium]|nr:HD domain-containing protein [Bacteroidales bacterium]